MELRKDPITQSWVILGQRDVVAETPEQCPLEQEKIEKVPAIMIWPASGPWQVRVVPHPDPLYRVEGDPGRLAEGMYDKMGALGAHEVVVETPQKLTKKQRELLTEFERLSSSETQPESSGFLGKVKEFLDGLSGRAGAA